MRIDIVIPCIIVTVGIISALTFETLWRMRHDYVIRKKLLRRIDEEVKRE